MFNIKFFLLLLLVSTLYGKKDFYYNFINPDLTQISQIEKRKIVGASDKLKEIRRYITDNIEDIIAEQVILGSKKKAFELKIEKDTLEIK